MTAPPHPARATFAATMPPWDRWPPTAQPPRGTITRGAVHGESGPAPTHAGQTGPCGPGTGGHGRLQRADRSASPPLMAPPWGQDNLDYTPPKEDNHCPSAEAERAAALDLDLWLPRNSDKKQLNLQVWTRWLLLDVHHIRRSTCTMADIIYDPRRGRHTPAPTIEHPRQWRYAATRLMAHMGVYTPDDLDRLQWRWHHRAALRIWEALIRHHIPAIPTPVPEGKLPQAGPQDTSANGPQQPRDNRGRWRAPTARTARKPPLPWLPHTVHSAAPSGRSPTHGQTTAVSTSREQRPDNRRPRRRSHDRGRGDRQAHKAKVAQRPLQGGV